MRFKVNMNLVIIGAVGFLAISGDFTATWSSPMHSKLLSNNTSINPLGEPITAEQDALIGSLVNMGAIIGPLPLTHMADKFGRKIAMLCVGIPHLVSFISFAFTNSVYIFYFGRLLGGLALGAGCALLPMYIAEISDDAHRGLYSSFLVTFWSIGDMFPYVVGPFLSVQAFNLILAAFPLTFLILFIWCGTETPYYWLTKNDENKAVASLMYLRSLSKKDVEDELNHIKLNFKREEGGHFSDIVKNPGLRKAFFIAISLTALQQLGGINAISFYLQPIFEASGSKLPSDISSLIYGVVLFFTSFIAPPLVNIFNRKTLLTFSYIGMTFALAILAAFFYIHDSTDIDTSSLFWLPLVGLILYLILFSTGCSILPWTIAAELFPTSCKQISSAATTISCSLTSFVLTQFFNKMIQAMTTAGVFCFFGSWCLVAITTTIIFVPETKGKSFREIQDMLGV